MREMKDSGVEWIGDIPEGWNVCKTKYVSKTFGGLAYNPSDVCDQDTGTLVLRASNINNGKLTYEDNVFVRNDVAKNKLVQAGSVLICSCNGSPALVGKNALIPDNLTAAYGGFMMLAIPAGINNRYFRYSLNGGLFDFYKASFSTTTINQLTSSAFREMTIPLPDGCTQKIIADYLDTVCADIDTAYADTEEEIALLKAYKQATITEAVTKGLDPDVEMKDSGIEWIGAIPKNWHVGRVKHIASQTDPYPIGDGDHGLVSPDDYVSKGVPYIRVLNLTWGFGLDFSNMIYISDETNAKIKNSQLKPEDILIAKTGATIGKTAMVPSGLPISNTTSHVGKVTVSPDHHSPRYFYYVLTSHVAQKQIEVLSAMQATRPELGISGLKNLNIPIPSWDVQKQIADYLDTQCSAIDEQIADLESELTKLTDLKKSLIYDYVTGKAEVPESFKKEGALNAS